MSACLRFTLSGFDSIFFVFQLGQNEPEGDNKVVINKVKVSDPSLKVEDSHFEKVFYHLQVKAPEASVGKEEPEEDSEDAETEEEGDIDFGDDGQGSSDELEYEEDEQIYLI